MSNLSPLLCLPIELRLSIAAHVVGEGPSPLSATDSCCLESFALKHIANRNALFSIPGFTTLSFENPQALAQNETIVVVDAPRNRKCASVNARESSRQFDINFFNFGHAAFGSEAPDEWLVDDGGSVCCWNDIPTPIADDKTVKLILDEVNGEMLVYKFDQFFEYHAHCAFEKLVLCFIVPGEPDSEPLLQTHGVYHMLGNDVEEARKGAEWIDVVRTDLVEMVPTLTAIEFEFYDGRGKDVRVLTITLKEKKNDQDSWTIGDWSDSIVSRKSAEKQKELDDKRLF